MSALAPATGRRLVVGAVLAALVLGPALPAGAAGWPIPLAGGSAGLATAGTLGTSTGVSGTCGTGSNKGSVIVAWSAVPMAASYTILQSTTSATTGFSTAATGVVGTSWTSPALANGSWWFQVVAVRNNWSGPASAATAQHTISGNNCS